MIRARSSDVPWLTEFSNGEHQARADATPEKGGGNLGFRPHELLEAALASCMNITLRMAAAKHGIAPGEVVVTVTLNRLVPAEAVFTYSVNWDRPVTDAQRAVLIAALDACPVRNTLSRSIRCVYAG